MTNTPAEWRRRPPTGMSVTIYPRQCGYHVLLHATGPTMESRLRPELLGKSCVPYRSDDDRETMNGQLGALVVGVSNIFSGAPEDCNRL